jgi:hypothetical protein
MNLNITLITGQIDLVTPKPVILEIIDLCRAKINFDLLDDQSYRELVIKSINQYKDVVDVQSFLDLDPNSNIESLNSDTRRTIKKIASFVNPNIKWSLGGLKNSFVYLYNLKTCNSVIPTNVTFGLQTGENLYNFNNCVCYYFCKKYNIYIDYNTTEVELQNHIKILSKPEYIKSYITHTIFDYNILVELYSKFNKQSINTQQIDVNLLTIAYNTYKRVDKKLLHKLTNLNLEESITIGVLLYDIDISYCDNPVLELLNLHFWCNTNIWNHKNFNLVDKRVNIIFKCNPKIFVCSNNFNHIFPHQFYSTAKCLQLYESETCTKVNHNESKIINDYHSELQEYTMCNNFYHGFHLQIKNSITEYEQTSIYEYTNNEIICYGIKNLYMNAYSYAEINAIFKNEMNFTLPNIKEPLSKENINKLINLCNIEPIDDTKRELCVTINDVKIYNDKAGQTIRDFCNYYKNCSNLSQTQVRDVLQKLLELGMYMRGWSGTGDLPISIAPVDDQINVDINVTNSLITFNKSLKCLERHKDLVLKFPLMKYHKMFYFSNNIEDGKTLGDRLELFQKGENTENMGSCVRLTSNFIISTAHKMYTTLKLEEPFDIKKMRNIG